MDLYHFEHIANNVVLSLVFIFYLMLKIVQTTQYISSNFDNNKMTLYKYYELIKSEIS